MTSDDTEHTCLIAQSLIASARDKAQFTQDFSWRLRFWLLGLPAGLGRATILGCIRLWLGWNPKNSGVFSAGNGPAMRVALLGVVTDDVERLAELVSVSTRMTHSDAKAEWAAMALALAAWSSVRDLPQEQYLQLVSQQLPPQADELTQLIKQAADSAALKQDPTEFANALGCERGVSGYCYHTVPVALHAWMRWPNDFELAVQRVIACGGDADTIAAIAGALIGIRVGPAGIPERWQAAYADWPRTLSWMTRLGVQLDETLTTNQAQTPLTLSWYQLIPRNLFFLLVVLTHAFRRLLP